MVMAPSPRPVMGMMMVVAAVMVMMVMVAVMGMMMARMPARGARWIVRPGFRP
jgi:hypothetical protein